MTPGAAEARELLFVVRVRRIDVAAVVSIVLHVLFFVLVIPRNLVHDPIGPITDQPLNVVIAQPQPPAPEPTPVTPPEPVTSPAPPRPTPLVRRPPVVASRVPTPAPQIAVPAPSPQQAPPPTPQVDMMAAMQARRAERRAQEAAAASPRSSPSPSVDAAARNLQTLSGREGVGGVFEILRKGTRTAEFAFNGWRPESRRQWREVIEVDAGQGGNVELAIIKRMIQLIRNHYTGDFQWESHRLQRVVKLSAAPEDNEGLEDFMMLEFFGQPVVNPRRR